MWLRTLLLSHRLLTRSLNCRIHFCVGSLLFYPDGNITLVQPLYKPLHNRQTDNCVCVADIPQPQLLDDLLLLIDDPLLLHDNAE